MSTVYMSNVAVVPGLEGVVPGPEEDVLDPEKGVLVPKGATSMSYWKVDTAEVARVEDVCVADASLMASSPTINPSF